MSINRQDSRHRIKRSNLTGVEPTAHTASTDFTDGTWLNTDIREGEFFYNIPDVRLWVGTGTSSREIEFVGGTAGAESLADTLAVGNIVPTDQTIRGASYSYISMGATTFESAISIISGDNLSGTEIWAAVNVDNVGGSSIVSTNDSTGDYAQMVIDCNTGVTIASSNTSLGYSNTSIDITPLYTNIILTDNMFNVIDDIIMDKNGIELKSTNQITSGYSQTLTKPSSIILTTDNNSGNISTFEVNPNESKTTLNNVIRVERGATTNTTALGIYTFVKIFGGVDIMDGQMASCNLKVSGYDTTNNKTWGGKFFCVFERNGGVISQIGTTDLVAKENFGDGTRGSMGTDGTDIILSLVQNNALPNIAWSVIYEYIITP